jgi:hypothetical protein
MVRGNPTGFVIESFLDRQLVAMPTRKDDANRRR